MMDDAIAKLHAIARLRENWDGYGARPISWAVVARVLDLLRVVAPLEVPEPAVVPTPEGGLHLEWHVRGLNLQVEATEVAPYWSARVGVAAQDGASISDSAEAELKGRG